jgi:transposase
MISAVVVMEDTMGKLLVPDELWERVEPILPKHLPSPKGGKPRKPDRLCLTGILFVLKTGIPWEDFPQEMGCCGMTLWNRLSEWMAARVWPTLHRLMLDELRGVDAIDFSRVIVDSSSVRAVHGGKKQAPAPSIAVKMVPNITSWSMPAAFQSPAHSPPPIATT